MMLLAAVLLLHAMSTLMMTGLIWFVQVVHYPLMAHVGEQEFVRYEREHMRRTTWVVAPVMLTEAACAGALLLLISPGAGRVIAIAGMLLLLAIWGSTALLQVPCHQRLSCGFDRTALRRLVATNWLRTAAWSARGLLAVLLLLWPA